MKIFQLIDLIIRLFRLNKKSKVVLLFLIPTFLVGQNNAAFWLGKRAAEAGDTDPFFSNVSLLLHMDGVNGSTTFTDNSNNNFTPTVFGNAQISTAQSKFGGASGAFDGNGDYLSIANNSAFQFGTGNFTIEAWVYLTQNPLNNNARYLTDFRAGGTNNFTFGFIGTGGITQMYGYSNNADIRGSSTVSLNTWNHVAYVRNGSTITLYLNGISNGTLTSSYSQPSTSVVVSARYTGLNEYIIGYIDDLRITKGVARYTSNFTPPTAPFPNN